MTKARRDALQWFYDRGAVIKQLAEPGAPSGAMMIHMQTDGQLELTNEGWCLTDKGRKDLWESR